MTTRHQGGIATARALGYLIATTARNRVRAFGRRARNPRQVIALLLGIGYFAFYVRMFTGARSGAPSFGGFVASLGQVFAVVVVLAMTVWWWVFGGDPTALAFTEAEVSFLFTAPVSRRQLVAYKLTKTQIRILFNVVVWVLILRRGSPLLPLPLRAIGIWIFFTALSLHRLGASLVRTSWEQHGVHGVRRHRVAMFVVALVAICIVVSIVRGVHMLRDVDDEEQFFERLSGTLSVWPAGIVLWPVRAAVSPMLAQSAEQWVRTVPPALLVLLLNLIWVVRSDAAFEEAAIAATTARAKLVERIRSRRAGGFTATKMTGKRAPPLSPTGPPTVAIIWKNIICLRRRAELGMFSFLLLLAAGVAFAVGVIAHGIAVGVAIAATVVALSLAVLGPLMLRVDLRQDMLNIVALKSLPMSGRTIVTAEVMSAVLPIAAVQLLLLLLAGLAASAASVTELAPLRVAAILAGGIPALIALDGTLVTIQNGAPVIFPAWTRLGAVVGGGVEVLGQGMLVLGIIFLILIAMLAVPVGIAGGILFLGKSHLSVVMVPALLLGTSVLGAEVYLALGILGSALEGTEPSEVA